MKATTDNFYTVYIDGFNLFYKIKTYYKSSKTNLKWLDIKKLSLEIAESNSCFDNLKLYKIKYFTAHVSESKENSSFKNQQTYLKALETLSNVELIYGEFKTVYPSGYIVSKYKQRFKITKPKKLATITKPEEKQSDVNLGIHMISDCYENNNLKTIVLISSDTDLKPAVKMIKNKFPNKKIVQIIMNRKDAKSMKPHVTVQEKLKIEHLQNSQFPDSIKTASKTINKPDEWKNNVKYFLILLYRKNLQTQIKLLI